jgi:hypothetical protein
MTFLDLRGKWGIAFVAVVLAMNGVSARAQDQSNQDQVNQNQSSQTQPNQNQPTQNQPEQNQSNPTQPSQDQPKQDQPSSQSPQQQTQQPENPPAKDKKDDSANPAQAATDATKRVAMQAADLTKRLGQATFVKARDWEVGWATGPYVGRQREMVPMTRAQRRDIYLQQTFLAPSDYFKRMFAAGIDQARGTPRQWGGGWGGYGQRFASREGQFFATNTLAAFGNAKLKYEPRYDQCRCSGFKLRTRHAIMRNFLTYNETERELRPQWALYGGAFAGGVIATQWKPHPRNALTNGGIAILGQAGYGALLNFFVEFAGDINRKLGAKGKNGPAKTE